MRLKRGPSRFWAFLFRIGLAKAKMPFWRVVVEVELDHRRRHWPTNLAGAVAGVFVWARTAEEAEGLAALALEAEGFEPLTADAVKCPPAARPHAAPVAAARTDLGFLPRIDGDAPIDPPSRRDARA